MTTDFPITLNDVRQASENLAPVVTRTPVLENRDVNYLLGGRLLIKAECAQRSGAFKIRGAYWRLFNLSKTERTQGVITYSSGNHALGLARAAKLLGSNALIVMPEDAPTAKISAVRALGAEIVTYNRDRDTYDDVVEALRRKTGRIHVPPSGHPLVLAGAGSVALELLEQAEAALARPDAILIPCGGGGLTAATALVAQALSPETKVFAVEPSDFDDTKRSLVAGRPVENPKGRRTICDAIMTPRPNSMNFPINLALLAGALVATDADVRAAMRFAYDHFHIVIEPGAAVGIAAILNGQIDIAGKTIATVVTGGNIDPDRFHDLLTQSN